MKKLSVLLAVILLISCLSACKSNTDNSGDASGTPGKQVNQDNSSGGSSNNTVNPDNYNCNIEEDRKTFDEKKIDIRVGDKLYATQINDWMTSFSDYEGKTVEIEGYYLNNGYIFVGRNYYVDSCCNSFACIEIYTDIDLSNLVSEQDWINVKGILRKGMDSGSPFYFIEAIVVEKKEIGKNTPTTVNN